MSKTKRKTKTIQPKIRKGVRRVFAVGCSHGEALDMDAAAEVLALKREFRPHITIHLGDWSDTTALLSSATGVERGRSIRDDCMAGIAFLQELEPQIVFTGNHDHRPYKLLEHNDAIVREAAESAVERIESHIAAMGARLIPYTGFGSGGGWVKIGSVVFGHGVAYNEQAARDHAEAFGCDVVFSHTHKLIRQAARTMAHATGYSVGCLCNKPAMGYAAGRRATLAWQNGCLMGEMTDSDSWLHLRRVGRESERAIVEMTVAEAAGITKSGIITDQ